jgi:hypothetical protein
MSKLNPSISNEKKNKFPTSTPLRMLEASEAPRQLRALLREGGLQATLQPLFGLGRDWWGLEELTRNASFDGISIGFRWETSGFRPSWGIFMMIVQNYLGVIRVTPRLPTRGSIAVGLGRSMGSKEGEGNVR